MWLKQATEGQSFLSADHVRTLQKSEIRRPLNHINNSPCNRDALCMGWNEVDREGLCAEDTTHTLGTQMRHHALKHHFKSNLDFSWPKEERLSGTSIGSHQKHVTQAPSFHSLAKSHRVYILFASHLGYLLTRSTVLTANQPLTSVFTLSHQKLGHRALVLVFTRSLYSQNNVLRSLSVLDICVNLQMVNTQTGTFLLPRNVTRDRREDSWVLWMPFNPVLFIWQLKRTQTKMISLLVKK